MVPRPLSVLALTACMLSGGAMAPAVPNRVASFSLSARVSPWEYVRPFSAVWESASRVYSPVGQILCGSQGLGRAPTISASPPLGHTLAKFSLDRALPLGAIELLSLHGGRILLEHRPCPKWVISTLRQRLVHSGCEPVAHSGEHMRVGAEGCGYGDVT